MDTLGVVTVVGSGGVAVREVIVMGDAVSVEVAFKVTYIMVVDVVALLNNW